MKKILTLMLFSFVSISFSQNWNYNFDQAKELATKENKNIIMIFSGSDWCAPCIRLDKNIWQSEEFKKVADEKWVLVKLNFPRKKANQLSEEQTGHNRALAEKYNKEGSFPLVIVLQPDGKVLGKLGFKNVSPSEYIEMIETVIK
ncbi:thioredoxin family protein [Flavobacterium sp.]|uniref:thioredoxin family protein n=1 Tax=Flavobacterium sp. TaxID=239 RepID=UPI003528B95B